MVAYLTPLISYISSSSLLSGLTTGVASWAGWSAAKSTAKKWGGKLVRGAKKLIPWVKANPRASGWLAGLSIGGYSLSEALDNLGISDNQFDIIVTGGLVVGVIAAFGSLFEVVIGGEE